MLGWSSLLPAASFMPPGLGALWAPVLLCGQRRSPHPTSGSGCSSADRSLGTPCGLPPTQVPSSVPRGPRAEHRLAPHLLPCPSSFLFEGRPEPPILLESPCPLRLRPSIPRPLLQESACAPSSPSPTQHPHPLQRTPSWPGLPLPGPRCGAVLRGLGPGQLFSPAASCFAHQEAALAPAKTVAVVGLQRGSLAGPGPGAVNSSGPRQPLPLPAHPSARPPPRPAGVSSHMTCRDPKKTKHCYPHPHQQLLAPPTPSAEPCPQVTPGERKVQKDKCYPVWNNSRNSYH